MPTDVSLVLLAMAAATAVLAAVSARLLVRREGATPEGGRWPWLQLAVFMLIAVAALWLFGEVADNVIDRDELARLDGRVMTGLAPMRTGAGLAVAQAISFCATVRAMSIVALLIAFTVHRRNWLAVLSGWTLVIGGEQLVEGMLKRTIHRLRPPGASTFIDDGSYSYPSGHSMEAMIGFGVIAYLLLIRVHRPAARMGITLATAFLMLAVGVSRLVLGVHYFTDVIGGFAAGAVWLSLVVAAVETQRPRGGTVHDHVPVPTA